MKNLLLKICFVLFGLAPLATHAEDFNAEKFEVCDAGNTFGVFRTCAYPGQGGKDYSIIACATYLFQQTSSKSSDVDLHICEASAKCKLVSPDEAEKIPACSTETHLNEKTQKQTRPNFGRPFYIEAQAPVKAEAEVFLSPDDAYEKWVKNQNDYQ